MNGFKELKDELQRLIMIVIGMEQRERERRSGKVQPPEGFPSRSHTGTWRGRQLEPKEVEDKE